ncbi:hypothetical protein ACFSTE_02360 [Aquimarina hainanensis]|uniref:DUF4595 domain-containing protein n=1 Tax=Aquimarina hainanensis TaxID=1578017 RepID=A0ABW5N222_9FLAO|nr:hypothetical protein [Aquimarina sp. TRL1]QKX04243.1 hypothetical protein HN014_04730 [Aquimarina sp. TRL1]
MKQKLLLVGAFALSVFFISCNKDSVTDQFDNANGDVAKKLIESVSYDAMAPGEEDYELSITYDGNNRVTSATNGEETAVLTFENNQLSTVSGEEEPFSIDELYKSPYDAFEIGEVLDYDDSGNPVVIKVIDEGYDYENGEYVHYKEELTATITYDATPNPFFYTFEAAGLIEIMDKVMLNFSMKPQSPEIVKARTLFPVNNISSMVYKDEDGAVVAELTIAYVYDADDYPTAAVITIKEEGEPNEVYSIEYKYR